ncbi:MAG: hypothetical protein WD360_06005 [Nitriliruptoraceae bacterium]
MSAAMSKCEPGLRQTRSLTVEASHTTSHQADGVVATASLMELAENACIAAVCDQLDDDETSVAVWAELELSKPAAVGDTLNAKATLIGCHGPRLEFAVAITNATGPVARVNLRRKIVARNRLSAALSR